MLRLAELMERELVSQRALAKAAGCSASTLGRLIKHGEYPKRIKPSMLQARLREALLGLVVVEEHGLDTAFEAATERVNDPSPDEASGNDPESIQEKVMLIRKQGITPEARDFYSVRPEALMPPWKREQVYLGHKMRVVYEYMLAKARFGGVLAVTGESGSGKSTIKDLLVSDLAEQGEVVVIEPHTQAMEASDKTGKTLKTAHICQAIMYEVAPQATIRASMEGQLNQVAKALVASMAQNKERRHLLIIDEAHALPKTTLRHLKRFIELKNPDKKGLQRPLLSIILLGQPELSLRLSSFDQEVREVWQRCEMVTLPALDRELEAYVQFRLGAAAAAFTPEALAALRAHLTTRSGESFLYPLAVDNWLAAIINQAAGIAKTIVPETVNEVYAEMQKSRTGEGK